MIMSQQESNFIRWFGGIAGSLLIALIIGAVVFFNSMNKTAAANEVRFQYIQQDIKDIKSDLKELKSR